jgi:hypothetical protein
MPARNNKGIVMIVVTHTAVAMERLGFRGDEFTQQEKNSVVSVRSVSSGYKKYKEDHISQLSFVTTACQDMSLEAEDLRHQNC